MRGAVNPCIALALLACGDESTPPPGPPPPPQCTTPIADATSVPLRGPCAAADRFGAFVVEDQPDFSTVSGQIADGVVPVSVLNEVFTSGDCRLLQRRNPFCNPPCGGGETCDFGGSCIPYPANQDIGTVILGGLNKCVAMEPIVPGNTYFDTQLPDPAYAPGDVIEMRTTAGAFGELQLHGVGVEPLALVGTLWAIESGVALAATWNDPGPGVRSTVHLSVNIDQHGNSPVRLECDFADTGSATVPADAIDALLSSGVSGFPSGRLSRRTVDSVTVGAGCAELVIAAPLEVDVRVAGHVPCTSDAPCLPFGQTCNLPIQTCE